VVGGHLTGGRRRHPSGSTLVSDVAPLDALLKEGTRVVRAYSDTAPTTESDVEEDLAGLFGTAPRIVRTFCSTQNLDRMDRIRQACRRSGRTVVMDFYAASLWEACCRAPTPSGRWAGLSAAPIDAADPAHPAPQRRAAAFDPHLWPCQPRRHPQPRRSSRCAPSRRGPHRCAGDVRRPAAQRRPGAATANGGSHDVPLR
jgi:hypothetical protein